MKYHDSSQNPNERLNGPVLDKTTITSDNIMAKKIDFRILDLKGAKIVGSEIRDAKKLRNFETFFQDFFSRFQDFFQDFKIFFEILEIFFEISRFEI